MGSSSSNPLWKKLTHHALIGNGQFPLSEELKEELKELNIEIDDEKHALLESIALVQLLEKGAQAWIKNEQPKIKKPSFGEEKICSWQSMQDLQTILDGHHATAFPEFVHLLAKHSKSLPPKSLPALLDQCVANIDLWQLIKPILGKRGHWLLQQNPVWQVLLPVQANQSDWFNLVGEEMISAFARFRISKPDEARKSLIKRWNGFDFKIKTKLLSVFNQGLSLDDEDFLEQCLDDKRKGVRQLATAYLAEHPDSRLVKRLFETARECLTIKNNALHINLPEELPNSTLKDGIYPSGSKLAGGLKMNWLHQLLARIPFDFWEKEWQFDTIKTIQLFAQSGHPSVVYGITKSLLQFTNPKAIDAQITMWFNSGNDVFWQTNEAKALLNKASADLFNDQSIHWLEQYGPFIPSDSLVAYWLNNSKHKWQKQLTKIVIFGFQDLIQNHTVQKWDLYHYKNIIQMAAYHSDPKLLDEFKKKWYMQFSRFGFWANDFENLLQVFNFRLKMEKHLS